MTLCGVKGGRWKAGSGALGLDVHPGSAQESRADPIGYATYTWGATK
jgi:hypothetical protein